MVFFNRRGIGNVDVGLEFLFEKPNIFCSSNTRNISFSSSRHGKSCIINLKISSMSKEHKSEKSNEEGEDEKGFVTLVRLIEDKSNNSSILEDIA
ncbi:hypothetical protein Peur_012337 [Populus x canadensis]